MSKKKNVQNLNDVERYSPQISEGLSSAIVLKRKAEGLINKTKKRTTKSYLNIIASNIFTFFNLLGALVTAALIFVNAPLSNFVFVIVYIFNMLIGLVQEIRAKICVDRLSLIARKKVKVVRNGVTTEISPSDLVVDDIAIFGIGAQIPTDSIILEGEIEVNESLLTGESVHVKKTVGDEILSGSFIVGGTCTVKVNKVGKFNYINTLTEKAKKYKKPKSEIFGTLSIIIKSIGLIIIPLAFIHVLRSTTLFEITSNEAIVKTSTIIIGMIPSGMFLLTSLALAVGIIKLAKQKTLIQDLYSLEMLARVDTICFDKTGTLTDGNMTLKETVLLSEYDENYISDVMSSLIFALQDNNQTSIALYERFGQKRVYTAKEVVAFNSDRKLSAGTLYGAGTFAYGAPEFILSQKEYEKIREQSNSYAASGLRVLVLAKSEKEIVNGDIPKDFKPIAFFLIEDSIREEAINMVKWFNENDVAIKVISGDNPITVSDVARRVGIAGYDQFVSLEGMSESEVMDVADKYTVFGRVSPEQKSYLIKAIKNANHTVAMTGDGVNDILAMKEADCAVSVATGSDAAKHVSHIVLLDNNFDMMPRVVEEGRRVINNVERSSSLYLMKTFFTIILAILVLFLPYMKAYPFTLNQMIIIEIFVIGIPSFFLSLQPNNSRIQGNFLGGLLAKSLPSAVLMIESLLLVELFRILLWQFSDEVYVTMEVYAITFTALICLFNICSPLDKYRTALFTSVTVVVLLIVFYSINFGSKVFGLAKMTPLIEYWHHLLIVAFVFMLNIPLKYVTHVLFEKLRQKNDKKEKSE